MKKRTSKLVLMAIAILIVFAITGCSSNNASTGNDIPTNNSQDDSKGQAKTAETTEAPDATEEVTPEPTKAAEPYTAELSAGYYTAGVDFPAGKYNLTAVSGGGNVFTEDGALNEIIGVDEDDMYTSNYNNAGLDNGVVLIIGGNLVLEISSEAAEVAGLTPRENTLSESVDLSSGSYVAGTDFPAGVYNIVATKGSGNVFNSDGTLNEILGTDDDGMSIKEYKNFNFAEGDTLEISGLSVQLVPSK